MNDNQTNPIDLQDELVDFREAGPTASEIGIDTDSSLKKEIVAPNLPENTTTKTDVVAVTRQEEVVKKSKLKTVRERLKNIHKPKSNNEQELVDNADTIRSSNKLLNLAKNISQIPGAGEIGGVIAAASLAYLNTKGISPAGLEHVIHAIPTQADQLIQMVPNAVSGYRSSSQERTIGKVLDAGVSIAGSHASNALDSGLINSGLASFALNSENMHSIHHARAHVKERSVVKINKMKESVSKNKARKVYRPQTRSLPSAA